MRTIRLPCTRVALCNDKIVRNSSLPERTTFVLKVSAVRPEIVAKRANEMYKNTIYWPVGAGFRLRIISEPFFGFFFS